MKDWIIKTFFLEEATRLGSMDAFKKAHADILETMADDLDDKAEILAKEKLSALLGVIDMDKIVTFDKRTKVLYIGGVKAEDTQLANLRAEVQFFLESELWKLLYETPKELAQRSMFVQGESLADMQRGKSILFTLSSQKNIIETIKNSQ